jgi:GNAT superfamily N-acetyltransferase
VNAPGATVRPFVRADADAAAALIRAVEPNLVMTGELLVHWLEGTTEQARAAYWVAERDGEIVGFADAELAWAVSEPGVARLWVGVRPDARGRGLGSAMLAVAERHLRANDARKLRGSHGADERSRRFADRHGYRPAREIRRSRLDVRSADLSELPRLEEEKAAEGFHVVALRRLLDRPRDLHVLYAEAEADSPADEPYDNVGYDEWEQETLGNPLLDADASVVVVEGERPVAFSWLLVDREGGRGEHDLTGTLREYRGRRLARLAKLAVVRWCVESGVDVLFTGNDTLNAPMLTINDRLGYRPTVVRQEVLKEVAVAAAERDTAAA